MFPNLVAYDPADNPAAHRTADVTRDRRTGRRADAGTHDRVPFAVCHGPAACQREQGQCDRHVPCHCLHAYLRIRPLRRLQYRLVRVRAQSADSERDVGHWTHGYGPIRQGDGT